MTNKSSYSIEKYRTRLESLHKVLLGFNILYKSTVPNSKFEITNKHFLCLNIEAVKLIIGRIYVILFDEKKKYNTISFKILLDDILKDQSLAIDKKPFAELYCKIAKLEDELIDISKLGICPKDITQLLETAEKMDDELFLLLKKMSHSKEEKIDELEDFSTILWEAYVKAGIANKK